MGFMRGRSRQGPSGQSKAFGWYSVHWESKECMFREKQKKEGRSWVAGLGPLAFVHGYSKISMGVCSELCGTLSLHTFEGSFSQQTLNPS